MHDRQSKPRESTSVYEEELESRVDELQGELEHAKKEMENLRKAEFLLSQILQGAFMPTFVIDRNHLITYWNRPLERLTGISAADMVGTKDHWRIMYASEQPLMADLVADKVPPEEICRNYDGRCRKSKIVDSAVEVEKYFPELGRWLLVTAAPLVDDGGEIVGAVQTLHDITERKGAEDELRKSEQRYRELSITDSLTKLHNSRQFFRQLGYEIERAKRYDEPLSLILLDIDNFKGYNDTYGHMEGDKVLRTLADVIRKNLRSTDTAYRYGGEEFTILLPVTEHDDAGTVAERVRKQFENTSLFPSSGSGIHMTVSLGATQYIPDEDPATFVKRGDEAMYKAKISGKNRSCVV